MASVTAGETAEPVCTRSLVQTGGIMFLLA